MAVPFKACCRLGAATVVVAATEAVAHPGIGGIVLLRLTVTLEPAGRGGAPSLEIELGQVTLFGVSLWERERKESIRRRDDKGDEEEAAGETC